MASRPHQARPRDASRALAATILAHPRDWGCCPPPSDPPLLSCPSPPLDDVMPPEIPAIQPAPVRLRAVPVERSPLDTVVPPAWGTLPTSLTALIGRDAESAVARALLVEEGVR